MAGLTEGRIYSTDLVHWARLELLLLKNYYVFKSLENTYLMNIDEMKGKRSFLKFRIILLEQKLQK